MKTNYRNVYKSDHLGVIDLEEMIEGGKSLVFEIKEVKQELNTLVAGNKINANICYFKEDVKPLVLNSTNSKKIRDIFKSNYVENWVDKKIELFIDSNVKFKGEVVGGIKVREFIEVKKEKITDGRFAQALKSIENGSYSVELLKEKFDLSKEQLARL